MSSTTFLVRAMSQAARRSVLLTEADFMVRANSTVKAKKSTSKTDAKTKKR
jgi:hypothetical protein